MNDSEHLNGRFALIDGVLYKSADRKTGGKNLVCIPLCMQEDVMYAIHDDIFGCHMGVVKTLDKLRERYYFPGMEPFVRSYIKSCRSCQFRKKERLRPYGLLRPIEVGNPFDMIGVDLWGPATMTKTKKRYIIVASDYLTRYVEIAALTSATSSQVAKFLVNNVFKNHGFVSKILTDRGTNFLSGLMEKLYDELSIEKVNTTHYHPQTDGLTEAFNKTMADMLSHYVSSDMRDWDVHLPLIQLAYNSSVSSATGFSPFFLVHGREPRLPLDVQLGHRSVRNDDDHVQSMLFNLSRARISAAEAIRRSQERSRKYYDQHRRPTDFQVGDLVLRYVPTHKQGTTNKLLHKFTGPHRISLDHGNNVYTLIPTVRPGPPVVVNAEHLKHFHDRCLYSFDDESADAAAGTQHNDRESTSPLPLADSPPATTSPSPPPVPPPSLASSHSADTSFFSVLDSMPDNAVVPVPASPSSSSIVSLSTQSSYLSSLSPPVRIGGDPKPPPVPVSPDPPVPAVKSVPSETSAADIPLPSSSSSSSALSAPLNQPPITPAVVSAEQAMAAVSAVAAPSAEPVPRRSTRMTSRPAKYTQALFFSLTVLCLASHSCASFSKVAPLVWRVTDRPVISGVTRVYTKVAYESPCVIFDQTSAATKLRFGVSQPNNYLLTELKEWCDKEFQETFLTPLLSFCPSTETADHNDQRVSREKRIVATAVLITTALISVVATIGVAAYASYSSTSHEIYSIEEQQNNLMKELEKNALFNDQVKEILTRLDRRDDLLKAALSNVTDKVYHLIAFHGPSITTVSKLGASLAIVKERFFSISQDWKRRILSPLFLDTLNVTLPCNDECPPRLMTPLSCVVDPLRKIIRLSFEQKTTKSKTQILRADPFRLIVNMSSESVCFGSYRGPHSVIYEERVDCVTPIRGDSDSNDNMILSPAVEYCSDGIPINESSHYWSKIECLPRDLVRDDDIIQIKSSDQYNYLYCQSLTITVFNRTFDCPNYVFSIPHFASFTIGKLTYKADNLKLSHSLRLAPVTSSRVNFHLLPTLPSFENDGVKQQISSLLPPQNASHIFAPLNHEAAPLAIVVFLLLPCFFFFGFKIYQVFSSATKNRKRHSYSPRSESRDSRRNAPNSAYANCPLSNPIEETSLSSGDQVSDSSREARASFRAANMRAQKMTAKQAALLCILSLCLTPEAQANSCPDVITLAFDSGLCAKVDAADVNTCNTIHSTVVHTPFTRICSSSLGSLIKRAKAKRDTSIDQTVYRITTRMEGLESITRILPFLEMQVAAIVTEWEHHRVHGSLFRLGNVNVSSDCSPQMYFPLSCRIDGKSNAISMTVMRDTSAQNLSHRLKSFFQQYNAIISLLSISMTTITLIVLFKRIKRRHTHSRLRAWNQSFDSDLPPPLRSMEKLTQV